MAPPATADLNPRASVRSALKAAFRDATALPVMSKNVSNIAVPAHNNNNNNNNKKPAIAPRTPTSKDNNRTDPETSPHHPNPNLSASTMSAPYYDDDHGSPYALASLRDAVHDIEATAAGTTNNSPLDNKSIGQHAPATGSVSTGDATVHIQHPSARPMAVKRYRIALMAWESLHSIAVGGVAPHLTELAAGLERRGHEVHVFVRTGAGQEPYQLIDGVHVHRVAFELNPDFIQEITNMCNAMVHFMLETEAYMNAQFDLIHCHDWLAAPALINIKHNHNRRCVFTVHSTEFGRCGNNVYGGQSARIRAIEQDAVAFADRVIAVSGVLCDEVKAHYSFDWDKLRCVYNGINCLRYEGALWDPAEVRAKYGVGPLDPMVLTVGRLVVQKGVDILVEAIPSVLAARPDAKFVIVGDGYMKDSIVARVHELGVQGSVCFTGSMGGQNLVDLFKATDLVAIPSRNEPFGIVVLEAWAASKPVVATKSGGPREFVWHDNDGFVVDTTAEGLAWGVCAAFANFVHMKYMGERGRVKAAFQFSWDNIAGNTNDIYDELLVDHPGIPNLESIKTVATVQEEQAVVADHARKESVTTI